MWFSQNGGVLAKLKPLKLKIYSHNHATYILFFYLLHRRPQSLLSSLALHHVAMTSMAPLPNLALYHGVTPQPSCSQSLSLSLSRVLAPPIFNPTTPNPLPPNKINFLSHTIKQEENEHKHHGNKKVNRVFKVPRGGMRK